MSFIHPWRPKLAHALTGFCLMWGCRYADVPIFSRPATGDSANFWQLDGSASRDWERADPGGLWPVRERDEQTRRSFGKLVPFRHA